MKNVLILLFLVFCGVASGQIIEISDGFFKNILLNKWCVDTNGDGFGDTTADLNNDNEIDVLEAAQVQRLIVNSGTINSLDGIEHFNNLIYLDCSINFIKSLDVRSLLKLEVLNCSRNLITSLQFNGLENLMTLSCGNNKLSSLMIDDNIKLKFLSCEDNSLVVLNVEKLINLEYLLCSNNKISTLNTSNLKSLIVLNCSYNLISSLNTSAFINLTNLECAGNKLQSINLDSIPNLFLFFCDNNNISFLNLDKLKELRAFTCTNNQLTSLDISQTKIAYFQCQSNQLKYLNIKNGIKEQSISFNNNSDLSYICCNEDEITEIINFVIINGQKCEVNSYCSFTPGGEFYILNGKNTFDWNNNGCDAQDIKLQNFIYNITDGFTSGSIINNSIGNYSIPIQAGTHTITPILEHSDYFEVTPPSLTVTFPSTSDTITQDFCITPKGILRQTNITVIPLIPPARPGFEAQYKIVWQNVGNQIEGGLLNFIYEETLLDYISATQSPEQIADGIVKWNFTNLLPFEKREITVTLKVNRPTDTPAINAGDKLYLTASILDNIFTLENTVVGSYDPNDKTCLQGDRVKPDMVGEYVDYLIRFENTGNYAAENVVVKDIIDTKTFDVSTLKITDASHEVYTRIVGNKVEFIFENIQLPFDDANNDGYVAFKIKTLPSLVLGDSLKNLADIYFDYNFPIRTNEAQTTIALPVFTKDITTEVNIYPNPVSDILYLDNNDNWSKAEIFDISGRIMRSISLDSSSIDVSGLESGTYFVRLKDGDRVGMVKFVKI